MRRRWIIILLTLVSLCLCSAGSIIYASGRREITVARQIGTGNIEISLEEYQRKGGEETLIEGPLQVLPGEAVSKIPRIINRSADCWIRVRLLFREIEGVDFCSGIYGMGEAWLPAGDGYYYYTEPLREGESIDVFQGIRIPADFPEELAGTEFYLDIDAEAVQCRNFTPDFTGMSPWGNIKIIQEEEERDGASIQEDGGVHIRCGTDVAGFLDVPEDFLGELKSLYPGDSCTDMLRFRNTENKGFRLYFRQTAGEDAELFDRLEMRIRLVSDGKETEIYSGSLGSELLSEGIKLGSMEPGKEAELEFTVTMPEELDNRYSARNGEVTWTFWTDEYSGVYTGDGQSPGLWMICAGISLGLAVLMYVKKKGRCDG